MHVKNRNWYCIVVHSQGPNGRLPGAQLADQAQWVRAGAGGAPSGPSPAIPDCPKGGQAGAVFLKVGTHKSLPLEVGDGRDLGYSWVWTQLWG